MKINELVEREDFYRIIEKSLENYYKNVFDYDLRISTNNNSILQKVFIYPQINSIVTRFPSREVLKYIFSEFNLRNNRFKFYAGKLYTGLCLFTGGLLANKTLRFHGINPINSSILIWPCNRKVRIFDFKKKIIDTILKEGFTNKYFNNEIYFRLNSNYSFVPGIIDHSHNWYRESLLPGQPLARITNNKQYLQSCNEAIAYIKIINDSNIRYVLPDEYAIGLLDIIEKLVSKAIVEKKIQTGDILRKVAKTAYRKTKSLNNKIPLTLSHGDLQAGNIWVDTSLNKTYIIDWETNSVRSIWYDPATLLLNTRSHNGIYSLVVNRQKKYVKDAILINDPTKDYKIDSIIGILVLEDIIFHLEDNLELLHDWGRDLIDQYGKQLLSIQCGLEKM